MDAGVITEAAAIIRGGGLVAFPTETVYGLGADACNARAVARIFEVKGRPRMDPLIVHVGGWEEALLYGEMSAPPARSLAERFWPGPLTLVVPRKDRTPWIVTAGLETVAIRVPAHPAALELIRASGCGIAAPSANRFGRVSPSEAIHVAQQLGEKVDLILDAGKCPVGVESTILSLAGAVPRLLRAGGTPLEEIENVIGEIERPTGDPSRPESPGQMERHYATRTPLTLTTEENLDPETLRSRRTGLLALVAPSRPEGFAAIEILSESGDLREAAANLFSALHRLDELNLDCLVAFQVPETGLGLAIMDRLRRCTAGLPDRNH